jgi:hypothetical protein
MLNIFGLKICDRYFQEVERKGNEDFFRDEQKEMKGFYAGEKEERRKGNLRVPTQRDTPTRIAELIIILIGTYEVLSMFGC